MKLSEKLFSAILLTTACILLGCSSSRQLTTQLVHDIRTDTIYLSNIKYDSIYLYQERFQDRTRDTIYLKDVSIEYRYKLLRDTIKVVLCDSVPYEVTIIETKEIIRPLTWYDHLTRATFWLFFGVLSVFAIKVIVKSFIL